MEIGREGEGGVSMTSQHNHCTLYIFIMGESS